MLASIAALNPAVGGEGDTIMHFFWANQALDSADALFRSWAKPFFTLFAAPWTLFGFSGIKIFNILCGTAASYFSCRIAIDRNWPNYWLVPLIAFSGPAFISYLNTGLTEPFGALVLISGIYFLNKGGKWNLVFAYSLLSFLPFCRSEAQVLLPVFALYGVLNKQLKYIGLLAMGTLFYSIVGGFFREDFFWVFSSPYVGGASVYGQGKWSHYLERLNIMLSLPINLAFLIGFIATIVSSFKHKSFWRQEFLLIALVPSIFILAHSVVWTLGIYASAGLERVLIMVFPLIWLLALYGLNTLGQWIKRPYSSLAISLFLLSSWYSNYDRKEDFKHYFKQAYQIGPYQTLLTNEIYPFIQAEFPNYQNLQLVSDLPYLSILSGHNPLNLKEQVNWQRVDKAIYHQIEADAIFIWDSHNVPFYTGVDESFLKELSWLEPLKEWEMGGRKYIVLRANTEFPSSKP